MGAGAEGGSEDKAKAEGEEDEAAAETELAVEVEAKVEAEAEARTGAFRLKNIKKMKSKTMAGRVKPALLTACLRPLLLMTWPKDFWP